MTTYGLYAQQQTHISSCLLFNLPASIKNTSFAVFIVFYTTFPVVSSSWKSNRSIHFCTHVIKRITSHHVKIVTSISLLVCDVRVLNIVRLIAKSTKFSLRIPCRIMSGRLFYHEFWTPTVPRMNTSKTIGIYWCVNSKTKTSISQLNCVKLCKSFTVGIITEWNYYWSATSTN